MTRLLILALLALLGCANVTADCPELAPEAPVCAPVAKCTAREAGYVWAGLSTTKVGECIFYRYSCVPNGEIASEECEQRWETVCDRGDVDAPVGGAGP